jgi:hypothetical protein
LHIDNEDTPVDVCPLAKPPNPQVSPPFLQKEQPPERIPNSSQIISNISECSMYATDRCPRPWVSKIIVVFLLNIAVMNLNVDFRKTLDCEKITCYAELRG